VPNSTLQGSGAEASALPGGYGGIGYHVNGENGSGFDRRGSELWQFGGGHLDWAGNEIHSIRLGTDSPGWTLRRDHSAQADIPPTSVSPDLARYYDGRPCSRHTYQGTHYIEKLEKYLAVGGYSWSHANGGNVLEAVTFDKAANDWDPAGTWNTTFPTTPNAVNGFYVKHPITEDIYFAVGGGYQFYKLNTATKVWSLINNSVTGYFAAFECATIDPTRNAMFVLTTNGDAASVYKGGVLYDLTTGARTNISFNASAAWTAFQAGATNHGGVVYNKDQQCFYYYFGGTGWGGRVLKITPNAGTTWDMAEIAMSGLTVPDGIGVANGNTLSRFGYAPELKAVYAFPSY
jgi:hypothetical protein